MERRKGMDGKGTETGREAPFSNLAENLGVARDELVKDLFLELADESPMHVAVLDRDGSFLYMNRTAERFKGGTVHCAGQSLWDVFPKEIADGKFMAVKETFETARPVHTSLKSCKPTNEVIWHEVFLRPLKDSSGAVKAVLVMAKDVSDLKESSEELLMQRNRLRTILDGIPDMVGLQLPDHTVLSYNKAGYEFLGKSSEEADGRKCHELIGRKDACENCATTKAVISGRPQCITKYVADTGRWFEVRAVPIFGKDGRIAEVVEMIRDISELKKKEEELFEKERERMAILEGLKGVVVAYLTPGMKLSWMNHALCDMISKFPSERDVSGQICHEFIYGRGSPCEGCTAPAAFESGCLKEGEVILDDGRSLLTRSTPVKDASGTVKGVVHIGVDITERKAMEESLRMERDRAEASARAKGEFLACVSHEIRTPLNAIIGMSDIIRESRGWSYEEAKDCCEAISEAGELLMNVVNDILDCSRIEAGVVKILSQPFDLKEELRSTCAFMGMQARKKGLDFFVELDDAIPEIVEGDPHHFRQIIVNLLGNAVKFTGKEHVRLSATLKSKDFGLVNVSVVVEDSGVGIPDEAKGVIFEPFTQEDSTSRRKHGGTGLGLSISRRLARLMGGDISVDSAKPHGALFSLQLPFTLADAASTEGQGANAISTKSINIMGSMCFWLRTCLQAPRS